MSGADKNHMGLLALGGIVLVGAAIALEPYRLTRLIAFIDPWKYAQGSGFQIIQSLYAVGSGGLFGVGIGRSRQKFFYLPEQHTDFIFAILAEELGFIGVVVVLSLFLALAWRGFRTALKAPDTFGSLLAAGITTWIISQACINMGVVSGSLPVTGIPLPFISSGGSSLIFTLIGIGFLLNISRYCYNR
jgi:cell division protein FtsW